MRALAIMDNENREMVNKVDAMKKAIGNIFDMMKEIDSSDEEKELASKLQEEIARDLPSIPLFANGYWYSFNTQYWNGWPTENNNMMPPLAMWGFGSTGLMQQVLWSLNQNVGQTLPTFTSDGSVSTQISETNDGAFYNIFIVPGVIIFLIKFKKMAN